GVLVLHPALFCCCLLNSYAYILPTVAFALKTHLASGGGEKSMVRAHADIAAGVKFRSALTHENVAGERLLAAELLHAETTAVRIATVARRTACLLVSHCPAPKLFDVRRSRGAARLNCLYRKRPGEGIAPTDKSTLGARLDAGDLDDRQILPVTALALGILAAPLLERDHLRPAGLLDDLAGDACARHVRGADGVGRAVEQRQNLVENHLRAGFAGQGHDGDLFFGGDRVLLAAGLDDCEHRFSSVFRPARYAGGPRGRLLCSGPKSRPLAAPRANARI